MKRFCFFLCAFIFLYSSTCSAIASARTIPVLLYHRLGPSSHPLYLSAARFENQVKALKEAGYNTLSLKQYEDFILGLTSDLPEKPILITFDDGYSDNYEIAFPILKSYGFKAAFFITTTLLDQPERITSSQLLEMHLAGMSFGSHTATHRRLVHLDTGEIVQELTRSKQTLEQLLQSRVESIAYPTGGYNELVMVIAENTGYKVGFTTLPGQNSRNTPPLLMKRIPVFSYSPHILHLIESAR